MSFLPTCVGILAGAVLRATVSASPVPVVHRGMCDASAGVSLDAAIFVVANDEDNLLRIYARHYPGGPLAILNVTRFLRLSKGSRETDIEGAARLEGRIYWITSHGRNAEGKPAANRRRFFATAIGHDGAWPVLRPVGQPCSTLLDQLVADPRMAPYGLSAAAKLAPKARGALNIEGLCATPEGSLLIGFRNPVPHGRALLVPLANAAEVVSGGAARFGAPIELDLDGLGIRDLLWQDGRYLLIAGPFDGRGAMRLYEWTGPEAPPRWIRSVDFGDTTPEALLSFPGDGVGQFVVLSDDGTWPVGCTECKKLKDPNLKRFRSLSLTP